MLEDKTIILGVTGCIAAYKAADITRELRKLGADVWVAMTEEAAKFVTPLTFRTLSGNPVITDLFSEELSSLPVPHISLTQRADLILVAPATANILAKASQGIADDPLTTMILSSRCPVIFAPAMNTAMWDNEATKDNVYKLKLRGHWFAGPERGRLACGEEGMGRLSDVSAILELVKKTLLPQRDMLGRKFLVTAGPTREAIDPVRYITNRSSGRMGYAIAAEAMKRGAKVTLISGPVSIKAPKVAEFVSVQTAEEMRGETLRRAAHADAVIMTAAVSDFRPAKASQKKIKKSDRKETLALEQNPDILEELGRRKAGRLLVGFALETEDMHGNALKKLKRKNLDLIVANTESAFDADASSVSFISTDGRAQDLPEMSKVDIAKKLLDRLVPMLKEHAAPILLAAKK